MKTCSNALFFLLALSGSARAAITLAGVDTTAGANWRTGANLETDSQYGTSGYVVFGLNQADNVYTQPYDVSSGNANNAYSLPGGVSISTTDFNIGMWSGNGNFGLIQDPVGGSPVSAPVLANSSGPRTWTINRASAVGYRITFLTASGDNEGTQYDLSLNDGSGAIASSWDHTANGLVYHVYDVTAGTNPIVLNVASSAQNRSITGIAFDVLPVPEPSTALLAGVAALGLLRRRRS